MREFRSIFVLAAVFLATVLSTRPARADVYEDVLEIVEQLVEDDIATDAVPNAATQIPITCDYFPATVAALQSKRFAGLPAVIRKEVADAVGFLILHEVDSTIALPASFPMLKAAVAKAAPQPEDLTKTPTNACGTLGDAHFGGVVSVATAQMKACAPKQTTLARELGCSLGLLARDAADGDKALLSGDFQRFVAALAMRTLPSVGTASDAQIVNAAFAFATGLAQKSPDATIAGDVCQALVVGATVSSTCTADVTKTLSIVRSQQLNLGTLEQALGIIVDITSTCGTQPAAPAPQLPDAVVKLCVAVNAVAKGSDEILGDLSSKNYGAAAKAVFGFGENLACGTDTTKQGCTDLDRKVYTFLQALAVYTIDSFSPGAPSTSAGAAFKEAAVDLIEAQGGEGVRRPVTPWTRWLVPEFAIRDAWRPGHIGTTGSQLFVYPSVDFLRARVHPNVGQNFYLGFHVSVIDPIGPVMEVATRSPSLENDNSALGVFFLGLIVPRFDVELGAPTITKHLVIGTGTALRFFRSEGTPADAHYCVWEASCSSGSKALNWDNVELSLFVKYVP
jgi:hypothetical protein